MGTGYLGLMNIPMTQPQQHWQRAAIQRPRIMPPSDSYVRSLFVKSAPPTYLTPILERADSFPIVLKRKTPVVMIAARLTQLSRQRQQEARARAWKTNAPNIMTKLETARARTVMALKDQTTDHLLPP